MYILLLTWVKHNAPDVLKCGHKNKFGDDTFSAALASSCCLLRSTNNSCSSLYI